LLLSIHRRLCFRGVVQPFRESELVVIERDCELAAANAAAANAANTANAKYRRAVTTVTVAVAVVRNG
jgi:hypothetical protein